MKKDQDEQGAQDTWKQNKTKTQLLSLNLRAYCINIIQKGQYKKVVSQQIRTRHGNLKNRMPIAKCQSLNRHHHN